MLEPTEMIETQTGKIISREATIPAFFTGLDISEPEGKILLFRCMQGSDTTAENMVNEPFKLVNYVMHPAEMISRQDGELIDLERCVMITDSGVTISTASSSIVRGVKMLLAMYGKAPFDPPIPVKIKSSPGKNGNRFLTLELLP